MARFFSASGLQKLTLETATARGLTWDVFVSHTTSDDNLADGVASCIRTCGLTAWVDSDYLASHDDGPGMASKIKRVIGRSYCLLAIVTNATNASWWVPFEIGVASETNKFLSTYGSPRVPLPSFPLGLATCEGRGGIALVVCANQATEGEIHAYDRQGVRGTGGLAADELHK